MATSQIVVFELEHQQYGIDIMKVIEIIGYQEVRYVPEVPDYIEGIINLRGEIYPIFNFRNRFHMPENPMDKNNKIILTNLDNIKVGFVVDNVCEILSIDESEIELTPNILTRYNNKYIKGISKQNDQMIILLDIDVIISDNEKEQIACAIA